MTITAEVDEDVKQKAERVLEDRGSSITEAVRSFIILVANGDVPADLEIPNVETVEAMQEIERGEGKKFNAVADLMADLYVHST